MKTEEMMKKISDWEEKLGAYRYAFTLMGLDNNQLPPSEGQEYRQKMRSLLMKDYLKLSKDSEIYEMLKELSERKEELDELQKRRIELLLKSAEKERNTPAELQLRLQKDLAASQFAWLKAKKENDYASYAPYLRAVFEDYAEVKRATLKEGEDLFDRILTDHVEGFTSKEYDAFFAKVKERLIPLLRRIQAARQIDDSFLKGYYPAAKQREFNEVLRSYLHFDPSWGKIAESEHPLTTTICRGDIRFTTKYREYNPVQASFSTIHESGHAYFNHQIAPEMEGNIVGGSISAALHESQSRLCENHLGRSLPFWEVNYPKLQKIFPEELGTIDLERFYAAINKVSPTLVRTEADELTYPLHIILRYELERDIFRKTLSFEDLKGAWNQKYEEYLGVKPENDAEGILQDMHWPYAYFGYFPTYLLGSAFAAQFDHAMRREIDVDDLIRADRYPEIMHWLRDNVHCYGNLIDPLEVLKCATKEEFNPEYYFEYLEEKYTQLYHLK